MTVDCFQPLLTALQQEGAAVLATVIAVSGSTPREVGAKLVLCQGDRLVGTIGGGAGEAKVIEVARSVLLTGLKQLVSIDLSGAPDRETQGICGGALEVWVERWQGTAAIALLQTLQAQLQAGQSVQLVTPFAAAQSPYLQPADAIAPANAFSELLQPPPTLLIVGAGHVGVQLAQVAAQIGFVVAVQDDRPEWANPQRYPQARWIWAEPLAGAIAQLDPVPQLYAALLTRGYQYDFEALKLLLQRAQPCRYIGMIGSKKRVQQVKQAIALAGFTTQQLQCLHAPIGLSIGALTPAEIAVSIAAELIAIRRSGSD